MYNFKRLRMSLEEMFPDKKIHLSFDSNGRRGDERETFWLSIDGHIKMKVFESWNELVIFCNKLVIKEYCKISGAIVTPERGVYVGGNLN